MRSSDIEYRIGANSSKFRKEMGSAAKSVKTTLGAVKGFAGGFIGGLGVSALIRGVRDAASSIAEMAGEAKQAGISFESWQELKFVADQNKISVDALTDGIKELQLRADEFVFTGKGPASEAFNRLGFSADELTEKLKKPNALFEEIIKRLKQVDKASQIRIADELFDGSGGKQFVKLLEDGSKTIAEMRAEAHSLGLIMSDELAVKAVELDRKFNIVSNTVGTALKSAIVDAAGALSTFLSLFNQVKDRSNNALSATLGPLNRRSNLLKDRIASGKNAFGFNLSDESLKSYKRALVDVEGQIKSIQNLQFQRADKASIDKLPFQGKKSFTPITTTTTSSSRSGGGRSSGQVDELTRLIVLINQRRDAVLAETAAQAGINPLIDDYGFALEKARTEQDLLTAAQKAGVKVTPDLASKISLLAGEYARAQADAMALAESQDEIRQRAEDFKEFGKSSLKGFISDLRAGKSAGDALSNTLERIADKLIDMAINNLFSNAFGGGSSTGNATSTALSFIPKLFGFAKGGIAANGRPLPRFAGGGISRSAAIFGEAGPEAAVPLPDGRRIPVELRGGNARPQRQIIDIRLVDDTGRMAAIADQRIQTSAGDIINVSVQQSQKVTREHMSSYLLEAQSGSL